MLQVGDQFPHPFSLSACLMMSTEAFGSPTWWRWWCSWTLSDIRTLNLTPIVSLVYLLCMQWHLSICLIVSSGSVASLERNHYEKSWAIVLLNQTDRKKNVIWEEEEEEETVVVFCCETRCQHCLIRRAQLQAYPTHTCRPGHISTLHWCGSCATTTSM
jgi:hypothetical protein